MPEQTVYYILKDFISTVGFPILVALWLLIRGDKLGRDAIGAIKDLARAIREGNSTRGQ